MNLEHRPEQLESENRQLRHHLKIAHALKKINRMLFSEHEHRGLIRTACEILVASGSYQAVRIILYNEDGSPYSAYGTDGLNDSGSLTISGDRLDMRCRALLEEGEIGFIHDSSSGSDIICSGIPHTSLSGILTAVVLPEFTDDVEKSVFRDIAENIGAAISRLDSDTVSRKFQYAVENLPNTVSFISSDFVYLYVNKRYKTLFGMSVDDVRGSYAGDFFDKDEFDNRILPMLEKCRNGESVDYLLEVNFKTIGVQWMHMYYYPYKAEDGRVDGILSLGIDVTELKKAEDNLNDFKMISASNEARFRQIIDTASDTVCIITEDGVILEINEYACNILGWNREELIGSLIELLDPDYPAAKFTDFWKDVPLYKQLTFESRHKTRDGRAFPVEISARKIRVDGGAAVISIARDITRRKEDEERIVSALKRAEEADRLKSAFLANMSHEIRTPLNGILGFSALLNDPEITSEKQQEYYSIIRKSGDRLLTTINDLIDISRVESGQVEIEMKSVNIKELCTELYRFFKPEIEAKNLDFLLEAVPANAVFIMTDRDKLYAVLVNLLKNAAKFTHAGGISFGYRQDDSKTEFFVKDSGIGIAGDKINMIFDRFVQADQSFTKPFEGSGLGLAICREYTDLLGGDIRVESAEGAGASFFVSIPHNEGAAE